MRAEIISHICLQGAARELAALDRAAEAVGALAIATVSRGAVALAADLLTAVESAIAVLEADASPSDGAQAALEILSDAATAARP